MNFLKLKRKEVGRKLTGDEAEQLKHLKETMKKIAGFESVEKLEVIAPTIYKKSFLAVVKMTYESARNLAKDCLEKIEKTG